MRRERARYRARARRPARCTDVGRVPADWRARRVLSRATRARRARRDARERALGRLPGSLGYDAGRALFHRQTAAGIACASCHPEGYDDGQVWQFDAFGPPRTQNLGGGILARAPYHWGGDMADIPTLMTAVFAQRMPGLSMTRSEALSLGPWLDRIRAPQPRTLADDATIARGQTLFQSQGLGCITCHVGPLYTNNALVDVGTGGTFKVPSLIGIALRAPYMHDGCAATLRDRFGTCGGGDLHGRTSSLSAAQLEDLVAFLESL